MSGNCGHCTTHQRELQEKKANFTVILLKQTESSFQKKGKQHSRKKWVKKEHHQKADAKCNSDMAAAFIQWVAGAKMDENPTDTPANGCAKCIGHEVVNIRCAEGKDLHQLDGQGETEAKQNGP